MFLFFLVNVCCEIFHFTRPNQQQIVMFELDKYNINTGFFKVGSDSRMKYEVKIYAIDDPSRPLYSNTSLVENVETSFSFNNSEKLKIEMLIKAIPYDSTDDFFDSEIEVVFKSTIDSFRTDVSKQLQYEPAIYALDHILKKLHSLNATTKGVYSQSGSLGQEQRLLHRFVIFISIVSLLVYGFSCVLQVTLMNSYLKKKKYL